MTKSPLVEGYVSKTNLTQYIKAKTCGVSYDPITLDIWKDKEDFRDSVGRAHLIKVKITIEND